MTSCTQCGHANTDTGRFCARCGAGLEIHIDEDRAAYNTPVAPGTIFEGKYQVLEEIGRGGMGVVYRGQDLSLGRMVAIKVLPEQFNTDEEVIARFKKEARAMAALDHPNIVPVYAIGQQRNFHYFVMKFLAGETMAEILERKRARGEAQIPPKEVRRIVVEVCKGLGHAHQRGLVHRDIKPGNIMLSPEGYVTIMDFGIVKEQSGGENLTRTGLVFGTPEYMAPEQAQGASAPGPNTDLYSLAVVAYEMLSGVPPFRGNTPFSVVLKHIKQPPPPLVDLIPGVSQALQDVVFRALAKHPEDRYPNAEEMQAALEGVAFDAPSRQPARALTEDLPPPTPLPADVPPPPAPSTPPAAVRPRTGPPPVPGPPASVESVPLPGNIPARAPAPPKPPARPFLPIAQAEPPPPPPRAEVDPAVVDDRPGHYRQMLTARGRQQQERSRRRNLVIAAVVAAAGITGLLLILFSMLRAEPQAAAAPATPQPTPAAAPDEAAGELDDLAEYVGIRVIIDSSPSGAEVYDVDAPGRLLGRTPVSIPGDPDERRQYTLRMEGYVEKSVTVSFHRARTETFMLNPVE